MPLGTHHMGLVPISPRHQMHSEVASHTWAVGLMAPLAFPSPACPKPVAAPGQRTQGCVSGCTHPGQPAG